MVVYMNEVLCVDTHTLTETKEGETRFTKRGMFYIPSVDGERALCVLVCVHTFY